MLKQKTILTILIIGIFAAPAAADLEFRDPDPIQFYTDLNLNQYNITGLPTPQTDSSPLTKGFADENYLNRDSDTLQGRLNANGNNITGLPTPQGESDAAPKSYVDSNTGSLQDLSQVLSQGDSANQSINMSGNTINNLPAPVTNRQAVNRGYLLNNTVSRQGDSINGTLDLSDENLVNTGEIQDYFNNACGSNQAVKDIQDDGTFVCGQAGGGLPTVLGINNTADQNINMGGENLVMPETSNIQDQNGVKRLQISSDGTRLMDETGTQIIEASSSRGIARIHATENHTFQIWDNTDGWGYPAVEYLVSDPAPGQLRLTNANLNLSGNKATNLAAPTGSNDAVRLQDISGEYVDLDGDTLNGNLNMNGNSVKSANQVDFRDNDGDGNQILVREDGTGGYLEFRRFGSSTNQDLMRIQDSGTVELPNGNLSLEDNKRLISRGGHSELVRVEKSGIWDSNTVLETGYTGSADFTELHVPGGDSNSGRLRLLEDGDVKIPNGNLDVGMNSNYKDITVGYGSGDSIEIGYDDVGSSGNQPYIKAEDSQGDDLEILTGSSDVAIPNGNIGVGTTPTVGNFHIHQDDGSSSDAAPSMFIQDPTASNDYGAKFAYNDDGVNELSLMVRDGGTDTVGLGIDRSSANVRIPNGNLNIGSNDLVGNGADLTLSGNYPGLNIEGSSGLVVRDSDDTEKIRFRDQGDISIKDSTIINGELELGGTRTVISGTDGSTNHWIKGPSGSEGNNLIEKYEWDSSNSRFNSWEIQLGGNNKIIANYGGNVDIPNGDLDVGGSIVDNSDNIVNIDDDLKADGTRGGHHQVGDVGGNNIDNSLYAGFETTWDTDYAIFGLRDDGSDNKNTVIANEQGSDDFIFVSGGADRARLYGDTGDLSIEGSFTEGASLDIAEKMPVKEEQKLEVQPGDVVGIKDGEVTRNTSDAAVNMVVSAAPGISLGGGSLNLSEDEKQRFENSYLDIAFTGQVPVKVRGGAGEGDYLLPSGENDGTAVAVSEDKVSFDEYRDSIGVVLGEFDIPENVNNQTASKYRDLLEKAEGKDYEVYNVAVGVK